MKHLSVITFYFFSDFTKWVPNEELSFDTNALTWVNRVTIQKFKFRIVMKKFLNSISNSTDVDIKIYFSISISVSQHQSYQQQYQ